MEENTGNSTPATQQDAVDGVFDSQDTFFDDLEQEVNGQVYDDHAQENSQVSNVGSPNQATYQQENQDVQKAIDWETRYKDSSREAQRMAGELKQLRPFAPVLNAMRKDGGLVEHVKDYFQQGGPKTKTMKEAFNLDEDFVFDANDAMENPDSDSGKVFNTYIDNVVKKRVQEASTRQQQAAQKRLSVANKIRQEREFREKHQMSDEEYTEMVKKAKDYKLTVDDVNLLVNRDKANANVADATKKDMLNQMRNVRNMPTTASGANSAPDNQSPDDGIFDSLLGADSELDNLFG